ncbi:hypothetical protein GPECTOR_76g813 [Gonium pectorale]|uniref:Uncharacterized protein n=1 Tax=Gonium pectorale TaxID=33097 RepID=A0A150G3X1_GONPE|nr:hypothetical protein GPECTOR_76g813 [Gonium pectorale]|eukprot:KXZ43990.1 hypothetical protein GPECTOR_76g813 [Gonium pectorale]
MHKLSAGEDSDDVAEASDSDHDHPIHTSSKPQPDSLRVPSMPPLPIGGGGVGALGIFERSLGKALDASEAAAALPHNAALLGLGRLRRSLNKDVFNEEAGGWIESEAAASAAAAVEAERARTPEERAEKWRESSPLASAALNGALIKQQLNDMSQFVKFKSAAHHLRKGGKGASLLLGLSELRDADRRDLAKLLSRQSGSKRRSRDVSEVGERQRD